MLHEWYEKWSPISKKEYFKYYNKAVDELKKDADDEQYEMFCYFAYGVKRKPIYPKVQGILNQIKQQEEIAKGKVKPIRYEYLKFSGMEGLWIVGSEEAEIVNRLKLDLNKSEDRFKLMLEMSKSKNK